MLAVAQSVGAWTGNRRVAGTATWRGPSSPPGPCRGALEQGTGQILFSTLLLSEQIPNNCSGSFFIFKLSVMLKARVYRHAGSSVKQNFGYQ